MLLKKFKVTKFRSILDSGWITCENVTSIVGVNEAGKSNLLLALTRLKPAAGGEIRLTRDLPRSLYAQLRDDCRDTAFVEGVFEIETGSPLLERLAELTGAAPEELRLVQVARLYGGGYRYAFLRRRVDAAAAAASLREDLTERVYRLRELEPEEETARVYRDAAVEKLREAVLAIAAREDADAEFFRTLLEGCAVGEAPEGAAEIAALASGAAARLAAHLAAIEPPPPERDPVWRELFRALPSFVYYSHYGNLDAEIYLPHAIENLQRSNLTGAAAAKARTLQVLFAFIGLDPREILELGADAPLDKEGRPLESPSAAQLKRYAAQKQERSILLESASNKLTRAFAKWWKQGKYIFDLKADGKLFKIWVSDERRPERVELEARSAGLQWFLSFYLTFLIDTQERLQNTILLLDEAGLSLHPLAQRDLAAFFEDLSKTNQIVHTTHSPFMLRSDRLDKVRAAYVDGDGYTTVAADLAAGGDPRRQFSLYTVCAAIGLELAENLLQSANFVLVDAAPAQHYLSAIRDHLASQGKFSPKREIVFLPVGDAAGIGAAARVVAPRGGRGLPFVILASDAAGRACKAELLAAAYREQPEKVVELQDLTGAADAQMEDLIPAPFFEAPVNRFFPEADADEFWEEFFAEGKLLPQITAFAAARRIALPPDFRSELARLVRKRIAKAPSLARPIEYTWTRLLGKINS